MNFNNRTIKGLIKPLLATVMVMSLFSFKLIAQSYNIADFGAVGDGKTMNTKAIQAAIDKCALTGGKVEFPKGTFLSGTLHLKSKVNLYLAEGAILLGSSSFEDYPMNDVKYKNIFTHSNDGKVKVSRAFIFAEGVENISITGKGTIDGNGGSKTFDLGNDGSSAQSRQRPCMFLIINSKHIKVADIHMRNSAYWMQNYIGCDDLHLKGLNIYNHSNYNQDAMDIDSRNVLIEDCIIDVDDDGICFKNHERKSIVENVIVRNCRISSNCNAIKYGTVGIGGFKNIKISDCVITAASADHIRKWQENLKFIELPVTVLAGIALEAVDGANIENVDISGIKMTGVQTPIFIVLGNRGRNAVDSKGKSPVGSIKNINISNIDATGHSKISSSITGLPGYYVENVNLNNIKISDMGKGTLEEAKMPLKENPAAYPENRMYGEVYPSSGFYIRHAKGVNFNDVKLSVRNEEYRPSVILNDVLNSNFTKLQVDVPSGKTAGIRIINSKLISLTSPGFQSKASPLIELLETGPEEIKLDKTDQYNGWLKVLE